MGVGVWVGTGVCEGAGVASSQTPSLGSCASVPSPGSGASGPSPSPGSCASGSGPSPVSVRPEPFREADHKFEWTREQFRAWAETGTPITYIYMHKT